jgi:type VI secretion system secreted protein VgrG
MPGLLEYHHNGVKDDTIRVREVRGEESISGLYRFEIDLFVQKSKCDAAKLIKEKVSLHILEPETVGTRGPGKVSKIHGMLSSFEQMEEVGEWVRCRAVLVPRLWKLTLTRKNRFFRDMKMADALQQILGDYGLTGQVSLGNDPVRKHRVQYRESDFVFISRWLEHDGNYYYFKHSGSEEEVCFGTTSAGSIGGDSSTVEYEPRETGAPAAKKDAAKGVVTDFTFRLRPLPKKVHVVDWDPTKVETDMGSADIDSNGTGDVYEYDLYPVGGGSAQALAKVRAEAIKCRGAVYLGAGRCHFFRAGAEFSLHGHYGFNGTYLLTRVLHRMSQAVGITGLKDLPDSYVNEFECIPASVPFRPERLTPWPKAHGYTEGKVTKGGGPKGGQMDDNGSYGVITVLDDNGQGQSTEHPAVRMAQPYAGASFGAHFPLGVDVEVLVGYEEGNPDRPVILSAVPNPKTKSPVVGQNNTQCVVKSACGNMIRMEDKDGSEDFFFYARKDKDTRVEKDDKETVGQDKHTVVKRDKMEKVEGESHEVVKKSCSVKVEQDRFISVKGKQAVEIGSGGFSLTVQGPVVEAFSQNHSEDVGLNYYLKAMGVVIEATTGITLKCGGNCVVVDMSGVTIKGTMVTLDGSLAKINSGPGSPATSGSAGSKITPQSPKDAQEAGQC